MAPKVLQPLATVQADQNGASSGAYVLELASTSGCDCVAAALSDGRCQLYAVSGATMDFAGECVGHKGAITGKHAPPYQYSRSSSSHLLTFYVYTPSKWGAKDVTLHPMQRCSHVSNREVWSKTGHFPPQQPCIFCLQQSNLAMVSFMSPIQMLYTKVPKSALTDRDCLVLYDRAAARCRFTGPAALELPGWHRARMGHPQRPTDTTVRPVLHLTMNQNGEIISCNRMPSGGNSSRGFCH